MRASCFISCKIITRLSNIEFVSPWKALGQSCESQETFVCVMAEHIYTFSFLHGYVDSLNMHGLLINARMSQTNRIFESKLHKFGCGKVMVWLYMWWSSGSGGGKRWWLWQW